MVADVHGHRSELRDALRDAGLVDRAGQWSGGSARLWLLGDYVDRGPDGIGVIDDVRELAVSAAAAGGKVRALLGNHEVQLLAAHRFGTVPIAGWDEPGGFRGGWARFGGREDDLRRLTPQHVTWITNLPAVAVVDGYLLVHSDTARYLEFGSSVAAVNAAVAAALACSHSAKSLELCGRMSDRGAFRDAEPPRPHDPVSAMLRALGGDVLVHGHSTLTRRLLAVDADRYAERELARHVTRRLGSSATTA